MLECKDKEQAVFYLYRLYNLYSVDARAYRPPSEAESLHTKGRKSNKRARAKRIADGEDDNEEAEVEAEAKAEAQIERELEEHGLPPGCAGDALTGGEGEGGALDCGSADEDPVDVNECEAEQSVVRKSTKSRSKEGGGRKGGSNSVKKLKSIRRSRDERREDGAKSKKVEEMRCELYV